MEIKTLEDQLRLIDHTFDEARNHPKAIGLDGLPYLRQGNRWWDSEVDQEKTVAQFTDVHSAEDSPLAVAALVAHVKDRVVMSITGDTNSVLLRIIVKFETRQTANPEVSEIVKDRYLVELQWVMPLPDIQVPDVEPTPLDDIPPFTPASFIPEAPPVPEVGSPPVIPLDGEELL